MTAANIRLSLPQLGWDSYFEGCFENLDGPELQPARIIFQGKSSYQAVGATGVFTAELSGRVMSGEQLPAVGDWVAVSRIDNKTAIIVELLPRRGVFTRKIAGGKTEAQVVAANVDLAFIVAGLDGGRNLNLRRIERFLLLCYDSGANPVIVLNKADVNPDPEASAAEVSRVAMGAPVHTVSAANGLGMDVLKEYLISGKTAVFLGPSGVGKSSLINALLGEARLKVGEVRGGDLRGRHTTTHRELFVLPDGGVVIDTPGIRELQLWADEESLAGVFPDIERLAASCRFRDCTHQSEPGCAVRAAVVSGGLDGARLESYLKLGQELQYLGMQKSERARHGKARWKQVHQEYRRFKKLNPD